MLPWPLLLSTDIVIQDPLVLQLLSQLLDLLFLFIEPFPDKNPVLPAVAPKTSLVYQYQWVSEDGEQIGRASCRERV